MKNSIYALIVLAFLSIDSLAVMVHSPDTASNPLVRSALAADSTDVQWFRDKMGIDPKYLQNNPGIGNHSWTYLILLALLAMLLIVVLISVNSRNRRTKELLTLLLKEKEHGAEG